MVGRKKEISELNRLYNKQSAELVAIYGMRQLNMLQNIVEREIL